jgi:tetratricopeptide (TPR) repeat protein
MTDLNQQSVFFVDDDLIEKLMRGDAPAAPGKTKREAPSNALVKAVELASAGRLADAIRELEQAMQRGEQSTDITLSLGHLYFEEKAWAKAADTYGKVIEANPSHRTAHYNLALCLERMGKLDQAAQEFQTAAAIDPSSWQPLLGHGFCLLRQSKPDEALTSFDAALDRSSLQGPNMNQDRILVGKAVAFANIGRMEEAEDLFKKLLPADPNSPGLLSNFIVVSMARKDDARVKELSERLLKVQPQSAQALQGLAAVALARGDYSAAVQHCMQLVKVMPDSYAGWFNLGIAYQKTGRWEQAGNAYREAALIRPGAIEASANLGTVLQERGDLSGARRAYERVLSASPDLPGALWNMAVLAEREANAAQAESFYQRLVAVRPDWEDAAFRLGYMQLRQNKHAAAAASFELCVRHRADWPEALMNLGLAHWQSGNLPAATEAYRKVLALNAAHPNTAHVEALRALTAIAIDGGNANEARSLYQQFAAAGGHSPELAFNLGLLLQSSGDPGAAVESYKAAVDAKPDFADALLNLGHALHSAGQIEEARRAWSKAVEAAPAVAASYFPYPA